LLAQLGWSESEDIEMRIVDGEPRLTGLAEFDKTVNVAREVMRDWRPVLHELTK
jgi:hypothetical protein